MAHSHHRRPEPGRLMPSGVLATPLRLTLRLLRAAPACTPPAAPAALAAPPTISGTTISAVTTTSATLGALLDPHGKATHYHFEYGPADCSANPCTTAPAGTEPQIPAIVK